MTEPSDFELGHEDLFDSGDIPESPETSIEGDPVPDATVAGPDADSGDEGFDEAFAEGGDGDTGADDIPVAELGVPDPDFRSDYWAMQDKAENGLSDAELDEDVYEFEVASEGDDFVAAEEFFSDAEDPGLDDALPVEDDFDSVLAEEGFGAEPGTAPAAAAQAPSATQLGQESQQPAFVSAASVAAPPLPPAGAPPADWTPPMMSAGAPAQIVVAPGGPSIAKNPLVWGLVALFVIVQTFAMFMAWQSNQVMFESLAKQSPGATPTGPIEIHLEQPDKDPTPGHNPSIDDHIKEPATTHVPIGTPPSTDLVEAELRLARTEIDEGDPSTARRRLYRLDANRDKFSLSETTRAEIEYLIAESYARAAMLRRQAPSTGEGQ